MALIYMTTNIISGKSYIGQSWNFKKRKDYHLTSYSRCHAIHSAINKYGKESFTWSILMDGIEDQEELDIAEEYFIWLYMTMAPHGYNIRHGGKSGGRLSDSTRKKLSIVQKGKKISEEHKKKISKKSKLMWENEDFRKKHKEAMARVVETEEWRSKNNAHERWNTRLENDPMAKEKIAERSRLTTKTEKWKTAYKEGMKKRDKSNMERIIIAEESGRIFFSIKDAVIFYGVNRYEISKTLSDKSKTFRGLHFSYLDPAKK